MIDPKSYPIEVRPLALDEGGGWLATFPDLPGCMGDGDTPQAAVADGFDAAQAWLATALAHGDPVPKPGAGAESGRFVTRVQFPHHGYRQRALGGKDIYEITCMWSGNGASGAADAFAKLTYLRPSALARS